MTKRPVLSGLIKMMVASAMAISFAGSAIGQSNRGVVSGSIEFEAVADIDPATYGLVNSAEGGLPATLWQGTPAALVKELLPQIGVIPNAPALRAMQRRFLISEALTPDDYDRDSKPGIFGLRLAALFRLGDVEAVRQLAAKAGIPGRDLDDPLVDKVMADMALLAGNLNDACWTSEKYAQSDDLFWLRLATFCQASRGETEAAELSAEVLAELGGNNALFDSLLATLFGTQKPSQEDITGLIDQAPQFEPLHLAMMRLARLQIPVSAFDKSGAALLAAVASSPAFHPIARLVAAEQAFRFGAIDRADLLARYKGIKFTEKQLVGLHPMPHDVLPAVLRALYVQKIKLAPTEEGLVDALTEVLTLAARGGAEQMVARALADDLNPISPKPQKAHLTGLFGQAAFVNGELEKALRWVVIANHAGSRGNHDAAKAGRRVWPLVVMKGIGNGVQDDPKKVSGWVQGMLAESPKGGEDQARRLRQVALVLGSLEALGHRIDIADWQSLTEAEAAAGLGAEGSGGLQGFGAWRTIVAAAGQGRYGESLAVSFASVKAHGLADCHPGLVVSVVTSLRQMGMDSEARNFAIDAAIAAGL